MITFDDVKRTTRETIVLFPSSHLDEVTRFMTLAGVLDECRILTYDEAKQTYILWKQRCMDELNAAIQAENKELQDWGPDLEWKGDNPHG